MTSNVRKDLLTRRVYSVDASIYDVEPMGVAFPRNAEEIVALLQHGFPLIPRGAATGTTGGCLGKGIVVDLSRHMNQILSIDPKEKTAVVEPGVVLDDLNREAKKWGLMFGPSTSTSNRATLGGMAANNAAGSRSLVYGQTSDHLIEVEMVLANGTVRNFRNESLETWEMSPDPLLKALWKLRADHLGEIEAHFPKLKRRVSGYDLQALVDECGLVKLIAGSEGSLGIMTKLKLRLVDIPEKKTLSLFLFDDMVEAARAVPGLLKLNPSALEMIDSDILQAGNALRWLPKIPRCILAVEGIKGGMQLTDAQEKEFWEVRKAGLGLLMSKRSYKRAVAFIEDLSVPIESLDTFFEKLLGLLEKFGKTAGIYGHIGEGCLHIRPYIDLRKPEERKAMESLANDALLLVLSCGGVLSGEHGDGLVRTWMNERLFHPSLYKMMGQIKTLFDPAGLMNPGKVVGNTPLLQDLRPLPPPYRPFFDFDFELSVDLCNGNGLCRKTEGTMCPSYQATKDEMDSTRARAQALRHFSPGDPNVHEILDLCLACKGCKKECPSSVDMAKMKAESLYRYQQKHGIPFRSRMFGEIGKWSEWGSKAPRLFNALSRLLPKSWLGIAPQRELPALAHHRFSSLFAKFKQPAGLTKEVILLSDTYTEFYHPEIGFDAVQVLNSMGYRVSVPPYKCCGRPLISKGMLEEAKALFTPFETDLPIVGLEPSCILTYRDEFPTKGETLDEFIAARLHELPIKPLEETVMLQGHCHMKALVGNGPTLAILHAIPKAKIVELKTGCCGMAGSFGFEKEHYDLSMKIGSLVLFPALKEKGIVVASGVSCRTQIFDGVQREALHLATFVRRYLLSK